MRLLKLPAHWGFSLLFTWLLNQRITDTPCGTTVLRRDDDATLKANRHHFGSRESFGYFGLIDGAAKVNLKTREILIRDAARRYARTSISRLRHGLMLLRRVVFAWRRLKAF